MTWWHLPLLAILGVGCATGRAHGNKEQDSDTGTSDSDIADSDSAADTDTGTTQDPGPLLGLDIDEAAVTKFVGEEAGDAYSLYRRLSVSGGCDVDADGLDDIVIGLGGSQAGGGYYAGVAYVLARPSPGVMDLSEAGTRWVGTPPEGAGDSVACLGDTNGDGFDDVLVAAPALRTDDGTYVGGGYLYLGPTGAGGVTADADATLYVEEDERDYSGMATMGGRSVAPAGDVNDDGFADMVVSRYDLNSTGVAYLVNGPVSGSVDLGAAAAFSLYGGVGDEVGYTVAPGGDLNADGFDDVVVSAPAVAARATMVFHGPLAGDAAIDDADAWLGANLMGYVPDGAGDVDGDGYADLIVDASDEDAAGRDGSGAAYIVGGPVVGSIDLDTSLGKLEGPFEYATAGWSVSGAGDLNADGLADVAVFAPGVLGGRGPGNTFLVFGPILGTMDLNDANATYHGTGDDTAGIVLAEAGDVDGDGFGDFLIGGSGDDDGGTDAGAVWLMSGATMF